MNQSNYKLIFSISISHSYFDEKIDPSIIFRPSESSKKLMTRFGLLFNQTENRFELYGNTEESIVSFLETIEDSTEITSLDFDLNFSNQSFYAYTELPIDWIGQLVFSSDNELNRIENENIVLQPSFIEEQNINRIGKLHIQFADLLNLANISNPVNFNISFSSRATQWQYYIVNSTINTSFGDIYIDSGIQFDGPVKVTLTNGQDALLFKSKTLIPLSNLPKHKLDLVNTDGIVIVKGLPNASPNKISILENNGEKSVTCPSYVYL